jgi:xanthine dehydrogenase YagS FAD-binding subunit
MRALDAVVETVNAKGRIRNIPIADFYRLPGQTPHIENALDRNELITSVLLPSPVGGTHIYHKVRDRASYAFALVSIAAILQPDGSGKIAVGGVAHKPWRDETAERLLPSGAKKVTEKLMSSAKPTKENEFKLTLVERTLGAVIKEGKNRYEVL